MITTGVSRCEAPPSELGTFAKKKKRDDYVTELQSLEYLSLDQGTNDPFSDPKFVLN